MVSELLPKDLIIIATNYYSLRLKIRFISVLSLVRPLTMLAYFAACASIFCMFSNTEKLGTENTERTYRRRTHDMCDIPLSGCLMSMFFCFFVLQNKTKLN